MNKTVTTQPSYFAYVVKDGGTTPKGFWTKVGVAFAHNDGLGFTLTLDALPLDGRLTLRKPDPKPKPDRLYT